MSKMIGMVISGALALAMILVLVIGAIVDGWPLIVTLVFGGFYGTVLYGCQGAYQDCLKLKEDEEE